MWTLSCFADEISDEPEEQRDVLRRHGVGWFEFRSAWWTNVLDLDDAQLESARRTLSDGGLRVSAIGSPIGKVDITDDFDAELARLDRALQVAAMLDAPFIRLFSYLMPQAGDPAAHRDEVLRRMAALAGRARGHDVVLLHENEKQIYGDVPARCLDIVESVGAENLRLVWDPANFVQCGVRPYSDGYRMLRPHVAYLHVKDALLDTGGVVPAGGGDGEVRETLHALHGDGFDGFFSLEPHLAESWSTGGFTGADLFSVAHKAFTGLLTLEGVAFR